MTISSADIKSKTFFDNKRETNDILDSHAVVLNKVFDGVITFARRENKEYSGDTAKSIVEFRIEHEVFKNEISDDRIRNLVEKVTNKTATAYRSGIYSILSFKTDSTDNPVLEIADNAKKLIQEECEKGPNKIVFNHKKTKNALRELINSYPGGKADF